MKSIYLTSSVHQVAKHIAHQLKPKSTGNKLLFIDTAAEVETGDKDWLQADKKALSKAGFAIKDFTLTNQSPDQIDRALNSTDSVYVEGGNTYYLLQQMQLSGFTKIIHKFVPKKITYIGTSAGSIVAGPDIQIAALGDDPNHAPNLSGFKGLGLTDISILPHWGSPVFKRDFAKILEIIYQPKNKYLLLNDYQYLSIKEHATDFIDVRTN